MIERSSGTRTPSLRALSRTPMAISSEAATIAVGRSAREQGGAVPGGRLGRPVRPEDPAVVAREVLLLDRREEGLEPVLWGLDVRDVLGHGADVADPRVAEAGEVLDRRAHGRPVVDPDARATRNREPMATRGGQAGRRARSPRSSWGCSG